MRCILALAIVLPFLAVADASGHSGGTNAAGCHMSHSTGDYHCHTPKSTSGLVTYCHVIRGEDRCGYAQSSCRSLVSTYGGYCVQQ